MASDVAELGKQELKTRLTRERILNAVIALITEGGFGAASSSQIARRAGVTWGAVQHHFGSKEQILVAILDMSHERFGELMERDILFRGSLADRTDQFVDGMWEHYQSDLYLAALEIMLAMRGDKTWSKSSKVYNQSQSHLQLMRKVFHDVSLSDEQMLDILVFTHIMLTGLTVERVFEEPGQNESRNIRRIKTMMLTMLTTWS